MENVLIIFGGRSAEHEISIRSARNIIAALNKDLFRPILVVISRSGCWYMLDSETISENMTQVDEELLNASLCTLMRKHNETVLITTKGATIKIDIVFPVLHGPMGEDGTIQGMFEMMLLPYVGSGVLSSAVSMDKEILKQRFVDNNIPIAPFLSFNSCDKLPSFKEVCKKLDSNILFIKPAVMGSSVGVSKVFTEEEFDIAIQQAFKYSFKIMIEKFIKSREVECSVLGNNNPIASCIGEIKPNHSFYSYEAKYLDPNGADLIIPAQNFSDELVEDVRKFSIEAFKAAECSGLARVDFLICDTGKIYVNELNTIPGFTSISMYPKMWEASGIGYSELITKLLKLAKESLELKQQLKLIPDIEINKDQINDCNSKIKRISVA